MSAAKDRAATFRRQQPTLDLLFSATHVPPKPMSRTPCSRRTRRDLDKVLALQRGREYNLHTELEHEKAGERQFLDSLAEKTPDKLYSELTAFMKKGRQRQVKRAVTKYVRREAQSCQLPEAVNATVNRIFKVLRQFLRDDHNNYGTSTITSKTTSKTLSFQAFEDHDHGVVHKLSGTRPAATKTALHKCRSLGTQSRVRGPEEVGLRRGPTARASANFSRSW